MQTNEQTQIVLQPIGFVESGRQEIKDDYWGSVISVIQLDADQFTPDVTAGLEEFTHLEVIFHMHKVPQESIETRARHPRNNPEWPLVGIFAQRPKARPNRLGLTRCRIVNVDGLRITVQALDAIEGTPILDLKPYMQEYGPIGDVKQPQWATELMEHYFR